MISRVVVCSTHARAIPLKITSDLYREILSDSNNNYFKSKHVSRVSIVTQDSGFVARNDHLKEEDSGRRPYIRELLLRDADGR